MLNVNLNKTLEAVEGLKKSLPILVANFQKKVFHNSMGFYLGQPTDLTQILNTNIARGKKN